MREQRGNGVVARVIEGDHRKVRTAPGRIVHVHYRFWPVQSQQCQYLLRQMTLLVIEGRGKAAIEISCARQHAVRERRIVQRRSHGRHHQ